MGNTSKPEADRRVKANRRSKTCLVHNRCGTDDYVKYANVGQCYCNKCHEWFQKLKRVKIE